MHQGEAILSSEVGRKRPKLPLNRPIPVSGAQQNSAGRGSWGGHVLSSAGGGGP